MTGTDRDGPHIKFGTYADVGPWQVYAKWPDDSGGGPTELVIKPHPDADPEEIARGITTGTLRAIPLPQMVRERHKVKHAVLAEVTPVIKALENNKETMGWVLASMRDMISAQPRPGRVGRPDVFYACVAFAYTFALLASKGSKAGPVSWLTATTKSDRKTVENWIKVARDRGMLSEPRPGIAEGTITKLGKAELMKFADKEGHPDRGL